jgi:hypothetical protein
MLCLLFLRVSTLSATMAGGPRTVPQVQANPTILAWGVEKRQTNDRTSRKYWRRTSLGWAMNPYLDYQIVNIFRHVTR